MNITINEFLADPVGTTENDCFGFFDWFCTDRGLKSRMLKLKGRIAYLVKMGVVDGDKNYVILKNNCPMDGELYDDFRVIDIETDEMICGLAPSLGYKSRKGKCEFWTFDAEGTLIETLYDSYKEFKAAVKNGEVTTSKGNVTLDDEVVDLNEVKW
tara:strand:- start:180 stop:647 length:468 start_codon:yes stop_codon:yes gene_type:complete